jgi:hypothetical protein
MMKSVKSLGKCRVWHLTLPKSRENSPRETRGFTLISFECLKPSVSQQGSMTLSGVVSNQESVGGI